MNTLDPHETNAESKHIDNSQESKNVSFINTIQYKTVPKDEIKHYKLDKS